MKKLVILTGAGMSAESGISTFRDSDGLWEKYRVEDVATPEGFAANPKLVLDFYNQRRRELLNTKPNAGHLGLAALEKDFDVRIITQNIDNLHERAGSSHVIHLHGELMKACSVRDLDTTYNLSPENPDIHLYLLKRLPCCRITKLRAPGPTDLLDRPERCTYLSQRYRAYTGRGLGRGQEADGVAYAELNNSYTH